MSSPLAGLPLRYLIGVDDDVGEAKTATEPGYNTEALPQVGLGVGYVNRRQERKGRLPNVDYIDPPDDIEIEYGEPAPVFGTDYFFQNIDQQCRRLIDLGFTIVEIDNIDVDTVAQVCELFDYVNAKGLDIIAKNPWDPQLLRPPWVVGVIQEHDDVNAAGLHNLRVQAQRPDMPIRVVTYLDEEVDQRAWALNISAQAIELELKDFGVTYSPQGEYETVEHIMRPVMSETPVNPVPPQFGPKPWNATLENDIGRYHDGPDVPMLASQTARVWPDDDKMASYVTMAGNGTAWCGIYIGWKLSRWGIKPPFADTGVGGWMYVDAWKNFGTTIDPNKREDGDIALWWKAGQPPHHIAFCWQGRYLGGNQNNTVNISSFRTPDSVRRAPSPENYVPQPEHMPMLMIESSGDAVRTLQTMLNEQNAAGLEVDGEFGPATEQAVKDYQAKHSLEVDGICGQETWDSLFDEHKPTPPAPAELLTADEILAIVDMSKASAIAKYSWKDRGVAPIGHIAGIAVMFGQSLLKLEANDSAVLAMSNPIGSSSKDALDYYGVQATGRVDVLRKNFVMLMGLGMREASGNYTEGRDVTATNVSADTCEAGLFQQSWNSSNSSAEMKKLLPAYQGNKQPCHVSVFRQGITPKQTKSYGSGPGYEFQELAKSCPAFATEMAGVGIRVLYNHWGPLIRKECEMRAEADALLLQVATYLAGKPEPPPPIDDIAQAKADCMASIEKAIDKLIADVLLTAPPSTTT